MKGLLLRISIGIFIGIMVTSKAALAVPSAQWGADLYETCALTKGSKFAKASNGDTYCCNKSLGHCVRCPKSGACSTISYSAHPLITKPKHQQPQPAKIVVPSSPRKSVKSKSPSQRLTK